jgi:glycolate oxidase iron-sulfur subunit
LYQRTGLQRLVRRSGLLAKVSPVLDTLDSLAPASRARPPLPERVPAQGERRAVVGLLTGCVQSVFFPGVNAATVRVLSTEGCDVVIPQGQGCCGALSVHSGREDEAMAFALRTIETFEQAGVDRVVVNAAGCGSSMKTYAELFVDQPEVAERAAALAAKVRDLSEFLTELGPVAERHPLRISVAYHDACHLSHAQGVRTQPRLLLNGIPGLELREIADGDLCCGSAGVYNLLNPEAARPLGDRKADSIVATGADLLVTANVGCLMQVSAALARRGTTLAMAHTVEVLDASLRGAPVESLMPRSGNG